MQETSVRDVGVATKPGFTQFLNEREFSAAGRTGDDDAVRSIGKAFDDFHFR